MDKRHALFPEPLKEFVKLVLEKWCSESKSDSTPFRWYGRYFFSRDHLLEAVRINPHDDKARATLVSWKLSVLHEATNELPRYYIGDVNQDIELIDEIALDIKQFSDKRLQEYWTSELEESSLLVKNYFEWKNSGHDDFVRWGRENKKQVGWV